MGRRLLRATLLAPVTGTVRLRSHTTCHFADFFPVGAALEARLDVIGGT
jgi:hypothetical protein